MWDAVIVCAVGVRCGMLLLYVPLVSDVEYCYCMCPFWYFHSKLDLIAWCVTHSIVCYDLLGLSLALKEGKCQFQ